MASTYNPYSDIQTVYNAKVAWNKATTDEERKKQNEIATAARNNLEAYGYSDVVKQISADGADATATRKIMEQYAPKTTAPDSTTLTTPELITTNNNETRNKINQLWGTQTNDREVMAEKYNKLEDTAYSNPFTTDEAKAILGKYDLAGLLGRDNAVASGGASNGGNIDSYAAANAMRQQASLVNQGQMAVLDAHNNKINNVKGILESLGVYQQNQDKGMQNTIGIQQTEAQRLFENEETAKNNEVARLVEQANVTGVVPTKWSYENNIYLNADGTVKDEFLTDAFDNTGGFTTIINNAKAKLATTTDATERANIQKTIDDASQAKALKTFSNDKYAPYAHEVTSVADTPTLAKYIANLDSDTTLKVKDKELEATLKSLGIEADLSKYTTDAQERMNTANNKNTMDQITANTNAQKELMEYQTLLSGGDAAVFTDDQVKEIDKVVKEINDKLKKHATNADKVDLIKPAVNGVYSFEGVGDSPKADAWAWEIVPVIYGKNLTAKEKGILYSQLGLSDEVVETIYKEKGWIE